MAGTGKWVAKEKIFPVRKRFGLWVYSWAGLGWYKTIKAARAYVREGKDASIVIVGNPSIGYVNYGRIHKIATGKPVTIRVQIIKGNRVKR